MNRNSFWTYVAWVALLIVAIAAVVIARPTFTGTLAPAALTALVLIGLVLVLFLVLRYVWILILAALIIGVVFVGMGMPYTIGQALAYWTANPIAWYTPSPDKVTPTEAGDQIAAAGTVCAGTYNSQPPVEFSVAYGSEQKYPLGNGNTLVVTCDDEGKYKLGEILPTPEAGMQNATPNAPVSNDGGTVTSDGSMVDWLSYRDMVQATFSDPYALIDWNDGRPEKKDHPAGGWTTGCDAIVWTGMYVDEPTLGGKAKKLLVDGLTGTFIIDEGTTVPVPGGEICLSDYDGSVPFIAPQFVREPVDVSADACVEPEKVTAIIDAFQDVNADQVFVGLDVLVDNDPTVRLRASGPGIVNADAGGAYIWTSGYVTNAELLLTSNGKKLFRSTGGEMNISHAFSGVKVCGTPVVTPAPSTDGQGGAVDQTAMCVPNDVVVATITDNRGSESMLYGALDEMANQYPKAVTTGEAGPVDIKWLTSLFWVNDGATGPVIALDTSPQHSLWLATKDGTAQVHAPYTMVVLCSDLDPARDFSWWGK